jgi:hypothetical protein
MRNTGRSSYSQALRVFSFSGSLRQSNHGRDQRVIMPFGCFGPRRFPRQGPRSSHRRGENRFFPQSGIDFPYDLGQYEVVVFQRPPKDGSRMALRGRRSSSRGRDDEATLPRPILPAGFSPAASRKSFA